jgi:hypothetical protein
MPIPEPADPFGLWNAVKPLVGGWIETDEDQMRSLSKAWNDGGDAFGDVLLGGGADGTVGFAQHALNLHDSWTDQAGQLWQRQILRIGDAVQVHSQLMHVLGAHVGAFADDVTYTKQQIVDTIDRNAELYGNLLAMPGGADTAAAQHVVNGLANAINGFIGAMAAQIGGRTALGVVPEERPRLDADMGSTDDIDLNSDSLEGASDWASGVSSLAAAGALVTAEIPPLAAFLGLVSLAGAGVAAIGHSARFANDPSLVNGVTLATDGLAIVPGVKGIATAAGKGGEAAAEALEAAGKSVPGRLPAPGAAPLPESNHQWINVIRDGTATPTDGWVRVAARFSNDPVGAAYGLQAASNAVPAIPGFVGLTYSGDHSDEAAMQGTVGSFVGRVVDNLPRGMR